MRRQLKSAGYPTASALSEGQRLFEPLSCDYYWTLAAAALSSYFDTTNGSGAWCEQAEYVLPCTRDLLLGPTPAMDGHFPPPMTPYGVYNPYGQPSMIPPESMQPRLHHLQTMSSESLGSYHSEYDDLTNPMLAPHAPANQQSSRSRRRNTHGADHIKHRRTRSGCFTCRQRRVKVPITVPGSLDNANSHSSVTRPDQHATVSQMHSLHVL